MSKTYFEIQLSISPHLFEIIGVLEKGVKMKCKRCGLEGIYRSGEYLRVFSEFNEKTYRCTQGDDPWVGKPVRIHGHFGHANMIPIGEIIHICTPPATKGVKHYNSHLFVWVEFNKQKYQIARTEFTFVYKNIIKKKRKKRKYASTR